jgi:hypothetical protein
MSNDIIMDEELKKEFRRTRKLVRKCLSATNELLAYYEQLSDQYEELRQEHVKNHGSSMLPIQIKRKAK